MKKRYFWAKRTDRSPHLQTETVFIHRFRSIGERAAWLTDGDWVDALPATDPEVRRIQRRIAAGEEVTFPVEVIQ